MRLENVEAPCKLESVLTVELKLVVLITSFFQGTSMQEKLMDRLDLLGIRQDLISKSYMEE